MIRRIVRVALLLALSSVTRLHAQAAIEGRVLDADGKPVPNVEVLLHAITESSGTEIDRDSSRIDGGFSVRVPSIDPSAVYFVAVQYNGELYIGDLLRPPFPLAQEYVVRIGVNPVDLGGAGERAAPPPQSSEERTAGIMVVMVAAVVIASILLVALRRRPPENRRLLVELARIEEELAGKAEEGDRALQKRRAELRKRLTAGSGA